ncbi:MAG: hypothetical protein KAJ03_03970, partial [Gammaproteobacteria bacterium]|nr:hypothetical protein [Gammaproteobacteria bacterium]
MGAEDNFCLSPAVTHKNGVPIGTNETKKMTYRVDYKSEAEKYDITVSRSKDHLWRIPGEPTLICFDIDEEFETEDEILSLLYQIDPQLEQAEMLIVHSSKSMMHDTEGKQLYGPRLHVYCVFEDGGRVQDYLDYVRIRMWDEGLGHIKVSASGGMLVRSIVDESVFADERIFFESPAELGEGLVSQSPEPRIIPGCIVSSAVCESITDIDRARNKKLVEEAKQDPELVKKVNELRPQYIDKETTKVQKETGLSCADAKEVVLRALDNSELESGFPIVLSDGTEVLVEEILNNPEKYDRESCLDPIEPDYDGGRVVGNIFVNENGSVVIHSFARGERNFILKRGKVSNKVHKSWIQEKVEARRLEQANLIDMCVERAIEYVMTKPDINLMVADCIEALRIKPGKKSDFQASIYERVQKQRDIEAEERREKERAELQQAFESGEYEPSDLLDKIDLSFFPEIEVKKSGEIVVLETDENLDHLLKSYGITLSNDVIAKLVTVTFPGEDELDAIRGNDGNSASSKIARMKSLCCRNNINDNLVGRMSALETKYYSNPI